jgi:hypothetical protein
MLMNAEKKEGKVKGGADVDERGRKSGALGSLRRLVLPFTLSFPFLPSNREA